MLASVGTWVGESGTRTWFTTIVSDSLPLLETLPSE